MVRLFEDMAITSALSDYFLPLKKVKQMLESNIFALKWERTLMRFPRMEIMAIRVVVFPKGGYKIGKILA